MLQGEVWTALGRIGQLLGQAERAFLDGDYKTSDRLLVEATELLEVARELQGRTEHVLLESPLMSATATRRIVDAAVRVVAARGPFAFVDVTLSASRAGEGLPPEEDVP